MLTKLKPTSKLPNGVTGFWFAPNLFIPMIPHSGQVGLLATSSGKGCGYRFCSMRETGALFTDNDLSLEMRGRGEPRNNEVLQICAARGRRLVVCKYANTLQANQDRS